VKTGAVILLLASVCVTIAAQPERIILIRHGEKPLDDDKSTLSPRGQERARALVSFLTGAPALIDKRSDVVLFATHFGKHVRDNHHEHLPGLAAALGVHPEPPKWKASVFDRVWVLTPKNGTTQMEDLPQRLLPGDSKD
jgi:hypothetical protein